MAWDGGWSEQYHVLANNREDALRYLKEYCNKDDRYKEYRMKNFELYENNPDFLLEFDVGEVNETEVS